MNSLIHGAGLALASLLLLLTEQAAAYSPDYSIDLLYQGTGFVTGTRAETRSAGFAQCLEEVVAKLSGNPELKDDPRLVPFKANAGSLVEYFGYRDALEGIPKHDEQGTHDRPFYLFCTFDHAKIDKVLASLGEKPWLAPRPALAVMLGVRSATGEYILTTNGARGLDQRETLYTNAEKLGMKVSLPTDEQAAHRHWTVAGLAAAGPLHPEVDAHAIGGNLPLSGTLIWNDKIGGWAVHWRLHWRQRIYRWRKSGISFDDAFRDGVGGAELILSGHGAPR